MAVMPKEQFHLHLNYSWLESETVFQTINISNIKALCFQNLYLKNFGILKTKQKIVMVTLCAKEHVLYENVGQLGFIFFQERVTN